MDAPLELRRRAVEPGAGGLSRRDFVAGLLGAGGTLALLPGMTAASMAGGGDALLFSPDHRALALSHGGEHLGLLSLAAGAASTAVLHTRRRQTTLPGLDGYLGDVHAAWMTGPEQFVLLDGRGRRLHHYSIDGAALGAAALRGRTLLAAAGCSDGAGGSFVSLPREHCIARLSADGAVLRRFGTLGKAPGQLNHPTALARQDDGSLIVANSGNHRIDRFRADGGFAGTIARFGFMPRHLALSGGTLAVYDPCAANVLLLSPRSGEQTAVLAVPKLRAGLRHCQSLTAAGTRRFLVSV